MTQNLPSGTSSSGEKTVDLKVGDEWNAIRIVALNQSDTKKSISELVENSIDAKALHITITKGKQGDDTYIEIRDDGEGVEPDANGDPDMERIPTHICDSIKHKLSESQRKGIQGQFGVGILGFWTVGESYSLTSRRTKSKTRTLTMLREDKHAKIVDCSANVLDRGSIAVVRKLLPEADRVLTVERLVDYLGRELRGRILDTGVRITIVDKIKDKTEQVRPMEFSGRYLQGFESIPVRGYGIAKAKLHLVDPKDAAYAHVSLERKGTRIFEDISQCEQFNHEPWNRQRLAGFIDYDHLTISPTRKDIVKDQFLAAFTDSLTEVETRLNEIVTKDEEGRRERLDKEVLEKVREAFQDMRSELSRDIDWFMSRGKDAVAESPPRPQPPTPTKTPGPLTVIRITPQAADVEIGHERALQVAAADADGTSIDPKTLLIYWQLAKDIDPRLGRLDVNSGPRVHFQAGELLGPLTVSATAVQKSFTKHAQAVLVVIPEAAPQIDKRPRTGPRFPTINVIPSAEGWHSQLKQKPFHEILINKTHPDYIATIAKPTDQKRYIGKLVAKELIVYNEPNFHTLDESLENYVRVLIGFERRI